MRPRDSVRVVLDTNVCLDVFVFGDPRAAALAAALASGELGAVTRTDCRDEWIAVLAYPMLKLEGAQRAEALARYDACTAMLPTSPAPTGLPRCRDADDQKFLELAATAGANVLFSRDAEVLRLGRRTQRDGLFAIMAPESWTGPSPT